MVSPVTGPFGTSQEYAGPPDRFGNKSIIRSWSRTSYRQKRPYTLPLPYVFGESAVTFYLNEEEFSPSINRLRYRNMDVDLQRVYNAAYSSFMQKVKTDAAELATTLVEWEKSVVMILDRATKLIQGIKAASSGDVSKLKRLWGKGAGIRPNLRRAGSNVLEYSFGWAPLISDIATAVKVLGNGIPPPRVRAKKTQDYSYSKSSPISEYGVSHVTEQYTLGWMLAATVRVTNPNTFLANQLGLLNPASVLWEIAPWSFVFDYVVNVSDFLASFTDLVGIELENPCKTSYFHVKTLEIQREVLPGYQKYLVSTGGYVVKVVRTRDIPGPTLSLRPPWRMSASRAATSVALLVQKLKGK